MNISKKTKRKIVNNRFKFMKKLIPDFKSKEFWINLLLGIITISILWWFGVLQWSYEVGHKFGYWLGSLF